MKKIIAKIALVTLVATIVTPAQAKFSLQEGIKKTAQSKEGKYVAALTLLALMSSGILINHNDYLTERFDEGFADSTWLDRLQHKISVIPEIFNQEAWLAERYGHKPFKITLGTSIAGLAALTGLCVYNSFGNNK